MTDNTDNKACLFENTNSLPVVLRSPFRKKCDNPNRIELSGLRLATLIIVFELLNLKLGEFK
jgi:hypothetical protein